MQILRLLATASLLTGLALTAGAPVVSLAQDPSNQCRLLIHVTALRNNNGWLGSTIFRSPDGWPENNGKAYKHGTTPIANNEATAEWLLPPGDYAVAVLHDENENHKLDRNLFHWPLEGFGFANNPHVGLTAPAYKDAVVHVGCPVTSIEIKAIYK